MALSCASDLLNCSKLFVRWLHGSCLLAAPHKSGGEDLHLFTFYNEISANPEVAALMRQIVSTLKVGLLLTIPPSVVMASHYSPTSYWFKELL